MHINVEKELDRCVETIGGRLIRDMVGASPNFDNADYLFDDFRTVAELKILSVDQMRVPNIKNKMSEIYREASDRGESDVIVYGEAVVGSDSLSPKYARMIGEVYRAPIQRLTKKANKQIRQTKDKLDRKDYSGLLILVNDNHRALEPRHVDWVLQGTLRNRNYSSVDSVLYFTANLRARHRKLDDDFFVWIEIHRSELKPCDDQLLKILQGSWFARMRELIGEPIPAYQLEPEAVAELENES